MKKTQTKSQQPRRAKPRQITSSLSGQELARFRRFGGEPYRISEVEATKTAATAEARAIRAAGSKARVIERNGEYVIYVRVAK